MHGAQLQPLSDAAPFWPSLWPALVATIVGVVTGLPIALQVNRWLLKQTRRAEEAARLRALSRAAHQLRWSISWNREKAQLLASSIVDRDDIPFDIPLEIARWEAVRDEFIRTAHDPDLQARAALFFHHVRYAAELAARRSEFLVHLSAGGPYSDHVDEALTDLLLETLDGIAAHEASDLEERLRELDNEARDDAGTVPKLEG